MQRGRNPNFWLLLRFLALEREPSAAPGYALWLNVLNRSHESFQRSFRLVASPAENVAFVRSTSDQLVQSPQVVHVALVYVQLSGRVQRLAGRRHSGVLGMSRAGGLRRSMWRRGQVKHHVGVCVAVVWHSTATDTRRICVASWRHAQCLTLSGGNLVHPGNWLHGHSSVDSGATHRLPGWSLKVLSVLLLHQTATISALKLSLTDFTDSVSKLTLPTYFVQRFSFLPRCMECRRSQATVCNHSGWPSLRG